MGVPMEIYSFKSLPKQTPFAPEWHYVFGESHITSVDYDRIAQLILEREHWIGQRQFDIQIWDVQFIKLGRSRNIKNQRSNSF